MTDAESKANLHRYLREGRSVLLAKLDGLGEYDLRRPMTPTGTNLLGTLKHVGTMEAMYLGECFGRTFPEPMPWIENAEKTNADMFATMDESSADIRGFYSRACAHADSTIEETELHTVGHIRWWTEPAQTLERVMAHLVAEVHRHAGQLDIVREEIDGSVGWVPDRSSMPEVDADWWAGYCSRLERIALEAEVGQGSP